MNELNLLVQNWIRNNTTKNKTTGCWEWNHFLSRGYGRIGSSFQKMFGTNLAHRLSYLAFVGKNPNEIRHMCHNNKCCNPAHLRNGTHKQNMESSIIYHANKRKYHKELKVVDGIAFYKRDDSKSDYWQYRIWMGDRYIRRSAKTEIFAEAVDKAKAHATLLGV